MNIGDELLRAIKYLDKMDEALLLLSEVDNRVVGLQEEYEDTLGIPLGKRIKNFLEAMENDST